jgi:predicted DNA-binding transcriptional regulator AlpA
VVLKGQEVSFMGNLSDLTFNTKELSEFIKVDKRTILRWIKDNPEFPSPSKVGHKLLWKRSDIEAYLESKKVNASGPKPEKNETANE